MTALNTGLDERWERILSIVVPLKDAIAKHQRHLHLDRGLKYVVFDLESRDIAPQSPSWAAELARGVRDTVIKGKPFDGTLGAYLQGADNHYLARSSKDERHVLALSVHPFKE